MTDRFHFYCDLQNHVGLLFERLTTEQLVTQEVLWASLRRPFQDGISEEHQRRLEAFVDGLQHNFSRLGLITPEYLVGEYWVPLKTVNPLNLHERECRLVWKKTGVVFGVIER